MGRLEGFLRKGFRCNLALLILLTLPGFRTLAGLEGEASRSKLSQTNLRIQIRIHQIHQNINHHKGRRNHDHRTHDYGQIQII